MLAAGSYLREAAGGTFSYLPMTRCHAGKILAVGGILMAMSGSDDRALGANRVLAWIADGLALRWRPVSSLVEPVGSAEGACEEVAALARRHRVAGALYHQAVRHEQVFARDLTRELGVAAAFDALLLDQRAGEVREVLEGLAGSGLRAIVLKGWALIATHFDGEPGLRPSGDIDILLLREDIAAARALMESLGYEAYGEEPWDGFDERYRYGVVYWRPGSSASPLQVELHWGLLDVPYFERMPVPDWFDRAQQATVAGAEALVPAPEDHFAYLCGHLALHHRYERALFRYHDLAVLALAPGDAAAPEPGEPQSKDWPTKGPSTADSGRGAEDSRGEDHRRSPPLERGPSPAASPGLSWKVVTKRASEWRLVMPYGETLARLADLWHDVVPAEVLREAAALRPSSSEKRVHYWMAERTRSPTSDLLLAVTTMPGVARRVRFIFEQAVPSPRYMRKRYPQRWSALWPLSYLQRFWSAVRYRLQVRE